MQTKCDYHPTRIAHWSCPQCKAQLCPECVTERDKGGHLQGQTLHLCPKCNVPVDWVGVANIIAPFWNRLPKIFAYPLALKPLILMAVLAVTSMVVWKFGLVGLILRGILWLIVLKYSFESLKATARGDLTPPKISSETISQDMQQVLKQYVMYVAIFFAFGWLSVVVGPILGVIFLLAILFFMPAMIILLVTTGSLLHALNPLIFVPLVTRIGWGYLLMYFFLFLLGTAPAIAGEYIMQFFPVDLHLLLFSFAKSYYTIVSYHLMGYVILQYHEQVGYQVDFEDFKDPAQESFRPAAADPDAAVLNEVTPLIQEGKLDEAIALIKEMTATAGITGLNLSERYFTLLKMRKRTPALLAYGIDYLELLASHSEKAKALEVYDHCRALDANFLPTDASLFKLGGWLNETGKTKEAVETYNRLVKAYPDSPLLPKAYFRAAQIFNDRLMNPERARKILNGLLKKYPEHEIAPQIKNYLASI
jgi:tetratricopeptide (TPR) repeat protein